MTKQRRDDGFTLIELLVVIIIIGILASIAIPVFFSQRGKAADSSVKSDLAGASVLVSAYFSSNQTFPTDAPTLAAEGVRVTKNNVIKGCWANNPTTTTGSPYILLGYNTSTGNVWTYDSLAAGIAPTPRPTASDMSCPSGFTDGPTMTN